MPLAVFFSGSVSPRARVCWPLGSWPQGRNRTTGSLAPSGRDSLLAQAAPLVHCAVSQSEWPTSLSVRTGSVGSLLRRAFIQRKWSLLPGTRVKLQGRGVG